MSTFSDHLADADAATEAVRALAHATVRFDHQDEPPGPDGLRTEHPQDAYSVLGDVLAVVRSLSQVAQQIAAVHTRNAEQAQGQAGSGLEGQAHVRAVHTHVRDTLLELEHVHSHLNAAMNAAGRITWQPPVPATPTSGATRPLPPDATTTDPLAPYGTSRITLRTTDGPGL